MVKECHALGFYSCSFRRYKLRIISLADEMREVIKKILYDPKNNIFKPKEDNYRPARIGNAFSSNYIEYKSNGDKDKTFKIILMKL